jgi:opacity protein-like surface antigen
MKPGYRFAILVVGYILLTAGLDLSFWREMLVYLGVGVLGVWDGSAHGRGVLLAEQGAGAD